MWIENAIKLSPTLIALIVGGAASTIAFFQYRIARDKFRLDLFSKRLEAYEKLQEFLVNVLKDGAVKDDSLPILAEARYKSRFIFGPEIESYFDELRDKAYEANILYTELSDNDGPLQIQSERDTAHRELRELRKWFRTELTSSSARYEKYLRFT